MSSNLALFAIIQRTMNLLPLLLTFSIVVLGFSELIVFNEEVLLALCFLSFVVVSYCAGEAAVSTSFEDQAKRVESSLLNAFKDQKSSLKSEGLSFSLMLSTSYAIACLAAAKAFSTKALTAKYINEVDQKLSHEVYSLFSIKTSGKDNALWLRLL